MRRSSIVAALLACAVFTPQALAGGLAVTDEAFCTHAQQAMAGTQRPSTNVVHTDFVAFRKSKTTIRPLETHQFVQTEPGSSRPMRVSCKLKTPDQINLEYGARSAADAPKSCRDLHAGIVAAVYARLTPQQRARAIPREKVILEPDEWTILGSTWVKDFPFAYAGEGGRLHLASKSLHVDWTNRWFAWAPNSVRGVYYCHLAAPEYVKRLVLGDAKPLPL
jgi:hypothetical protein